MPSNSANDFCTRALRLLNAVDAADTPSADMTQTAFLALNEMVDNWATQRQTIHTIARTVCPLTSGVAAYTLGIGGDWNFPRPQWIERVSVIPDNSSTGNTGPLEIPIGRPLSIEEYQRIAIKTATSTYPTQVYWDRNWVDGLSTVYVYPVPTLSSTVNGLQQLANTDSVTLRTVLPPAERLAQRLVFPEARTVTTVTMDLFRVGLPVGQIWATLVAGFVSPLTSTLLATSAPIDTETLIDDLERINVGPADVTFTFPPLVIPTGVTVYLILQGDYAITGTEFVLWAGTTTGTVQEAYSFDAGITSSLNPFRSFAYTVPAPTTSQAIVLYTPTALTEFADLATLYTFPPGYAKAIRYNLAVELAPELGINVPPDIQRQALASLADLKRANFAPIEANFDPALVGRPRWNIYKGDY